MFKLKRLPILIFAVLCMPVHAQNTPSSVPSQDLPIAMQAQVNAELDSANPSPDGLAFSTVTGYDGPRIKPDRPGDPHHVFHPAIVVSDDEKLIYCTTGTMLALTGATISQSYSAVALEADHRQQAIDDAAVASQSYLFYWNASDPGVHTLRVLFRFDNGLEPLIARVVRVIVSDTAPISFATLPPPGDANARISLVRATAGEFKPVRSMLIVNTSGFDLPDAQKELVFPASRLPVGAYALSIVSFSSDGTRFVAHPQMVVVQHGKSP